MGLWRDYKRRFFRTAAVLALLAFALPARAVTIHDLIALSKAGLSDQVLIALIQTDQTIYGVDAKQVLELKKAGVSEPVILALLRNGRQPSQPASAAAPASAPVPPEASAPIEEQAHNVTIIGDHSGEAEEAAPAPAESDVVVVQSVVPVFLPVVVGRAERGHDRRGARRRAGEHRGPASLTVGAPPVFPGLNSVAAGHHLGGGSINADGWRIVTPTIVPAHVPGQR